MNKVRRLIWIGGLLAGGAVGGEPGELGNYLANSDFAAVTASGLPVSWGTYHWGVSDAPGVLEFEARNAGWRLEEIDGAAAFRLDAATARSPELELCSTLAWVPGAGEYCFSVELKADRPEATAVLHLYGGWGDRVARKEVAVTDTWQRYDLSAPLPYSPVKVGVSAAPAAVIWLRRPQLESGTTPQDYRRSELDDWTPPVTAPGDTVVMTGVSGGAVRQPTTVTVEADAEAIRFHIRCAAAGMAERPLTERERDDELWRGNDSVQIFLAPEGNPFPYYQFFVDYAGNTHDGRNANPDWDGLWSSRVTRSAAGWEAEIAIPLANFNAGGQRATAAEWRWFVGREDQLGGENSGTNALYGMFHTARRFGVLRPMPVPVADLKIERSDTAYRVVNTREEPRQLTVEWRQALGNAPWRSAPESGLVIPTRGVVTVPIAPDGAYPAVGIVLREAGRIVATRHDNLPWRKTATAAPRLEELMLGVFWEHDLPGLTAEKLAVIAALGYNTVILQLAPTVDDAALAALLERLAGAGLRLVPVLWLHHDGAELLDEMARVVARFRDNPVISGWLVCDEPDLWDGLAVAARAYELVKGLDPDRPVWVNFSPSFKFNRAIASDWRSLDHYPIPEYDPGEIAALATALTRDGDPGLMFLQTTGHAYFCNREPTAGEVRFMVAAALLHRVEAFGFFANLPVSRELRAELPGIFRRFMQEAAIWRAPGIELPDLALPDRVWTGGRQCGAERYRIVVNGRAEAVELEIAGETLLVESYDYRIRPLDREAGNDK